LGSQTLAAVKAADPEELVEKICGGRLNFLQALPTWQYFGKGWGVRVAQVEQHATSMVS
jgi:hypothetical protein